MGIINKKLTDREKAAIYWHIFGGVDDWKALYLAALDEPYTGPEKNLSDFASKWKRTPKIQAYIETVRESRFKILQAAQQKGFEEGRAAVMDNVHTEPANGARSTKFVDYSDPANQARKLNELVNTADDPGEALDALKVIMQAQKADREAAKDNKIARFYLPLQCSGCPLLEKRRRQLPK